MFTIRTTALAASLLLAPATFASSGELRDKLAELASNILKATKSQPVTIGIFSGTGLPDTNSGPGLEGELRGALEHLSKGIVRDDAPYEVKGDYAFGKSTDPAKSGIKVAKIKARIMDKQTGEELLGVNVSLDLQLDGTRTLAQLLQLSASLPPDGSKEERNQKLDEAHKKPTVTVNGSLVSSAPNSMYAVEILARPASNADQLLQAKTAAVEKGQAFVNLGEGDLYEVRVHNKDSKPIAVALAIDGLDMYHFSKDRDPSNGRPLYSHSIIGPNSVGTFVGWHNKVEGGQNYFRFLVKKYGEGEASKHGIARGKTGIVHVAIAHCELLAEGQHSRSGMETGIGPPVDVKQKPVRAEIKPPHDFVAIRYSR